MGYRVCFTVEEHPFGWARHLSMSVADGEPGDLPHPEAIQEIGRQLGMRLDFLDPSNTKYLEFADEVPFAVSIIEPFRPAWEAPR
jgi:hypothetical protein